MFLNGGEKKKMIAGAAIVFSILFFAGVTLKSCPFNNEIPTALSGWLVDWHWQDGMGDLEEVAPGWDSIQVFGGYFDHLDQLFLPEMLEAGIPFLREEIGTQTEVYLTLVNDRYEADGTGIQKDSALLRRLLATEESRRAHEEQILKLVDIHGFDGIELDYEKIPAGSWDHYMEFITSLYENLTSEGKLLRIVLEPGIQLDQISLPEGPVYVMMAYNLFGYHSGPGPKADVGLIQQVAAKLDQIPGQKYIAFATGGFDWGADGSIKALTERQGEALSAQAIHPIQRDPSSGSLFFTYLDETQQLHTVWYADENTLNYWIETAKEMGYGRIAIWRLGHMGSGTIHYLSQFHHAM